MATSAAQAFPRSAMTHPIDALSTSETAVSRTPEMPPISPRHSLAGHLSEQPQEQSPETRPALTTSRPPEHGSRPHWLLRNTVSAKVDRLPRKHSAQGHRTPDTRSEPLDTISRDNLGLQVDFLAIKPGKSSKNRSANPGSRPTAPPHMQPLVSDPPVGSRRVNISRYAD